MNSLHKRYFIIFLIPWIFLSNLFFPVKSSNKEIEEKIIKSESYENHISTEYIIGPGDSLNISITEKTPDLNFRNIIVDIDGMITIPFINRFKIGGLTINEANTFLNEKYNNYVIDPNVQISLQKYREIKVYLDGEFNNPGLYTLEVKQPLTLFEVIKKSGGITNYADLSNIEVVRINNKSSGGGKIYTQLNLKSFIDSGDNQQNIQIFDKDTISISKSDEKVSSFIRKAIRTNLNPKTVEVYVMGNVISPGQKILNKQSGVIEAIEIAGGYRTPFNGNISFIRFNADGSIDKRKISPRTKSKRGTYSNPYLLDGDIIAVKPGKISKTSNVLRTIAEPFTAYIQLMGLYKILNE